MIEEHTCFLCASKNVGPIESRVRFSSCSLERQRLTAGGLLREIRHYARCNICNIFSFLFFFFLFLDATAPQCHAPPTLWSSDRRAVVDDTITHLSEHKSPAQLKRAYPARALRAHGVSRVRVKADDSKESSRSKRARNKFSTDLPLPLDRSVGRGLVVSARETAPRGIKKGIGARERPLPRALVVPSRCDGR